MYDWVLFVNPSDLWPLLDLIVENWERLRVGSFPLVLDIRVVVSDVSNGGLVGVRCDCGCVVVSWREKNGYTYVSCKMDVILVLTCWLLTVIKRPISKTLSDIDTLVLIIIVVILRFVFLSCNQTLYCSLWDQHLNESEECVCVCVCVCVWHDTSLLVCLSWLLRCDSMSWPEIVLSFGCCAIPLDLVCHSLALCSSDIAR